MAGLSDLAAQRLRPGVGYRHLFGAGLQSALVLAVLLTIYYSFPVESRPHETLILRLGVAIAIFVAALYFETSRVVRSNHPMLRAGVALITLLPFFILLFAWIYLSLSRSDPVSFNHPLSRTAALYFTVTVFSTVGFGDIVAKTDPARLVVTVQMISDLLVLALVVRLLFGVATRVVGESRTRDPRSGRAMRTVLGSSSVHDASDQTSTTEPKIRRYQPREDPHAGL